MKDQRSSPLLGQIVLFVAFLVLACVGVATVIVPELTEDPEAADDGSTADAEQAGDATVDTPAEPDP